MSGSSLFKIRIPSVIAVIMVFFLMAGIVAATHNINDVKKLFSFAQNETSPAGPVKIANVSDNSFTVVWQTDTPSSGAVFYGRTDSLADGVAVDERDLINPGGKYLTHFVRLSNLSESTQYFFKLGISQPSYGNPDNAQKPFEVKTGPRLTNSTPVDPIFGKINNVSGSPASGAVVSWQISGTAPTSSLVKSDGSYVLPVALARTPDLSSYFVPEEGFPEEFNFSLGSEGTSSIKCTYGSDRPLPTIKLGESVDCQGAKSDSDLGSSASSSAAHFKVPEKVAGFPPSSPAKDSEKINIVSGQSVSTSFPTLSGKVQPKQIVKIVIHSETPYSGTVIASSDGSWSWTPPAGLAPGQHTVTITIVNSDGTTQTVTRNFTVNSNEPLLPVTSGTPSAQTTHMACVINACTSVNGVGIDSCSTNSDCTATKPPVTGAQENTMLILTLGVALLLLGGGFLISKL